MSVINLVRKNIISISILLFVFIFSSIQYYEPAFLYDKDGSLRPFGLGSKKKTVLPIWLLSFILAIFCYLFVLWYITFPKFKY